MRVRVSEISPTGNRYILPGLKSPVPPEDFTVSGPFAAHCTLKRQGESKVEMQGRLQTRLAIICDRCLATYEIGVDTELHLLFEWASTDAWQLKEVECTRSDLDSIILDEPVVDLDDILRQQLYLALPMKNLCSEQCKGICLQCGANRNLGACSCDEHQPGSPFAVLAKLKEKKGKK